MEPAGGGSLRGFEKVLVPSAGSPVGKTRGLVKVPPFSFELAPGARICIGFCLRLRRWNTPFYL